MDKTISEYMAEIGRRGGQSKSDRKRAASSTSLALARRIRAEKKSQKNILT